MGWNKQSGERWVLQRTAFESERAPEKALALYVSGLLSIDDAEKLCGALAAEVYAAHVSEGVRRMGIDIQPWQENIMRQLLPQLEPDGSFINRLVNDQIARRNLKTVTEVIAGTSYGCRKCGGLIFPNQYRFGSPETGWEHMEGECVVRDERIDYAPQFDEDDGCPND